MDGAANEADLQQRLQRFATLFMDRITQASERLERSARPELRDEALRKHLLYVSSALEIVSGPSAYLNLLDLIVFVHLCGAVIASHWIPEVYGSSGGIQGEHERDEGRELARVFSRSEAELAAIAAEVMSAPQRQQLAELMEAWLKDNPDQVRVEGIRLADFTSVTGSATLERTSKARGLLESVRAASRTADQALLLGERGLFLLHRLPFLWRLQARLGARELLGDGVRQLSVGPQAPVPRALRRAREVALRAGLTLGVSGALLGGAFGLVWLLQSRARRR